MRIRSLKDLDCKFNLHLLFNINFFFSFCAVPVNKTAMLIIGGYSQNGALDSVELLDTESGRWEHLERLPHPR